MSLILYFLILVFVVSGKGIVGAGPCLCLKPNNKGEYPLDALWTHGFATTLVEILVAEKSPIPKRLDTCGCEAFRIRP